MSSRLSAISSRSIKSGYGWTAKLASNLAIWSFVYAVRWRFVVFFVGILRTVTAKVVLPKSGPAVANFGPPGPLLVAKSGPAFRKKISTGHPESLADDKQETRFQYYIYNIILYIYIRLQEWHCTQNCDSDESDRRGMPIRCFGTGAPRW